MAESPKTFLIAYKKRLYDLFALLKEKFSNCLAVLKRLFKKNKKPKIELDSVHIETTEPMNVVEANSNIELNK